MLDNLANVDLSGIGGYIRYTYDNSIIQVGSLFMALGLTIFLVLIGLGIYTLFTGTKSQRYRWLMEDMYLIGRIKQFADEDKVDLDKELRLFNVREKKRKLENKSISAVIEEELKDKIAKVNEDKIKEKK